MKSKIDFEEIWNLYYSKVKLYISKRIDNWQDAEDLTNDAFISAYKHYNDFDPNRASVCTWLFIIVKNIMKNYYRDSKITVSINDEENPVEIPAPNDIEQYVLLEEKLSVLKDSLDQLPEKQKKVIELIYFKELSIAETAKTLCTTEGNVRVIINRGKTKLKEILLDRKWY